MPVAALDNWQPVWNAQVSISTPVCVNFELRPGAGDIHICWFNFDALAQRNAYKSTKEPINYRGPGGDRTHDLQTEATPPAASCPARTLHAIYHIYTYMHIHTYHANFDMVGKSMLNTNNSLLSLFYNRCGNITMANTPSHNSHHEYWTAGNDHRPARIPESLLLWLSRSVFVANIAVDFIAVITI